MARERYDDEEEDDRPRGRGRRDDDDDDDYRPRGAPPPNYLAQSILVTLLCCLPAGVVAIVYAAQVDSKWASGDTRGARAASDAAKMWCWVSFGGVFAILVVYFAIIALAAAAGN